MLSNRKKLLLLLLGFSLLLIVFVTLWRSYDSDESKRNEYNRLSKIVRRRNVAQRQTSTHWNRDADATRLRDGPPVKNQRSRTRKSDDNTGVGPLKSVRRRRPVARDENDAINLPPFRDAPVERDQRCSCDNGKPLDSQPNTAARKSTPKQGVPLQSFAPSDKFTAIVTTTSSSQNMVTFLDHYCNSQSYKTLCSQTIVVWTADSSGASRDPQTSNKPDIPRDLLSHSCSVPLHFKYKQKFEVFDKYSAYPEIDTNAVLILEDTELLSDSDIILGFQTWQQSRYKIVGFEAHSHQVLTQHELRYVPISAEGQYSMITGKSVFIHSNYLEMFPRDVPSPLVQFVQQNGTGEVILLNAFVANYLAQHDQVQCSGVLVYRKKKRREKLGLRRQSTESESVQKLKESYLYAITQAYGSMPLQFCSIMVIRASAG